jgi:hypothetical protein
MSHDYFPYDDPLDELEQSIVDAVRESGKTLSELVMERIEEMKKILI